MSFKQLEPQFYLETTFGPAMCPLIFSDGHELWWCCFQLETGEAWWFPNQLIRMSKNFSEGRTELSPIKLTAAQERWLKPHRRRYRSSQPKEK